MENEDASPICGIYLTPVPIVIFTQENHYHKGAVHMDIHAETRY